MRPHVEQSLAGLATMIVLAELVWVLIARIQLLVASRNAEGSQGPGQGYVLEGTGSLVTSGEEMDRVAARFPWARGALVVHLEKASAHL